MTQRWRRPLVLALVLAAVLPAAAQGPSREYTVKAAYLLNFVRFVEWPAAAFPEPQSPLTICVFDDNPFHDALDMIVKGETVGGRSLAVRVVPSTADARPCHLIFVPREAEARAGPLFGAPPPFALMVGETDRFLKRGGAVNLFVDAGRVRFDVNLLPAERSGVRISARMLQLATRVQRSEAEP